MSIPESNRGWKALFTMVFIGASIPLHGWAVQFYWNTFLVTAVSVARPITMVHAMAISALAKMVTYQPRNAKLPDRPWSEVCSDAAILCVAPLLALAVGLLYRRWM